MIDIVIFKYFFNGVRFLLVSILSLMRWFVIGFITVIVIFPYYFIMGIYYLSSKERRKSVGFEKPIIPTIMMILSLATYFISIFIFTRWFVQQERIKKMSDSILESTVILEKEENSDSEILDNNNQTINSSSYSFSYEINADFDSLLSRNSDTVAWIQVNGTKINYSVVQASDNQYYLEHDFNKYSTNVGWIFGDYRDDFDNFGRNTIIYGHNLTNRSMFGSLPWILKSDWYENEDNYYINLATPKANIVWKVFSVYKIDPVTDYLRTSFYSISDYGEWLNLMKSRSIYDFGEDVSTDDKILTLSTCDDTGNKRVVLQAKMVGIEYK